MTIPLNTTCSKCGAENDAISDASDQGKTPHDGSITICLYCGHIMMFVFTGDDEPILVRDLTDEEMEGVMADEFIQRLLMVREVVMENRAGS